MKLEQKILRPTNQWETISTTLGTEQPQVVFCFGDRISLENDENYNEIAKQYPHSDIILVSTAGNIVDITVNDQSISATAVYFENSKIVISETNINDSSSSFLAGETLAKKIPLKDLKHVIVFADGHIVNGSELIKGISSVLPKDVALTGGLAGDDTRFAKTLVGLNSPPEEGKIVTVGFYGEKLEFGFGSIGGWDCFGIERTITHSMGNVLFELDNKPALELYKEYLREYAKDLPSSALLFPLAIRSDDTSNLIVRTILSIDENNQSMTFAGDIPKGWRAQLMKANFDRLIDGAFLAAQKCNEMIGTNSPDLVLLISCVGRRMVLDQRVEDEIEEVREVLGKKPIITGFYSYGEICPIDKNTVCDLHNQTMTITTISEKM